MSSSQRKRRSDYTLQEWTEHQRALERGYDAKRRAKKRADGEQLTSEERRELREIAKKKANPPPSAYALDTVIVAAQALGLSIDAKDEVAKNSLADLEALIKERISRLRSTIA